MQVAFVPELVYGFYIHIISALNWLNGEDPQKPAGAPRKRRLVVLWVIRIVFLLLGLEL